MQLEGGIDHVGAGLPHKEGKLVARQLEVVGQYGIVDGVERLLTGEADGEGGKVALQARVDGEAAGRGVHACHVLRVVDVFRSQLVTIVPVQFKG